MKAFAAQAVVVLALVSGFTINAEAKQDTPEVGNAISITSTTSSVGVLAN